MNSKTGFVIEEKQESSDAVCLYVTGDLDSHTSSLLKDKMNAGFSNGLKQIHIVLADVPRMDSSGIATLVEGLRWSKLPEKRFILSGLTDAVYDLFVLSKLESEFEILATGAKS